LAAEYSRVAEIRLYSELDPKSDQIKAKAATKEDLRATLELLSGKQVEPRLQERIDPQRRIRPAQPDDAVVLYVASHGYADPQGRFYVLPYDTGSNWGITEEILTGCQLKPDLSPVCGHARDLLAHSISSSDLANWWSEVDAGVMVMILDSCHSGAAAEKNFRPGPLGDPGLGQLSYDKGMQILAASQPAQTARGEWVTGGEGRTLLVDALDTVANADPSAPLGKWLYDIRQQLPITSKQIYPYLKKTDIQLPVLLDFTAKEH
jgi:hypothetical protein